MDLPSGWRSILLHKIVTDIKDRNVLGLEMIMSKLPRAGERVIPQVYQPENFDQVKKIGFNSMIWTLYHYKGTNREVLEWVKAFDGPFAVTMPISKARTTLPAMLAMQGVPTYVHTVNDQTQAQELIKRFSVSEIYTDFLIPDNSR